ncbi:hypothetical protein C8R47DRAFT_1246791 [Mycena vitilis]|nr:hypothetical protein C8R47DRAFT_1246791 [Mycena vitilis]
MPPWFMCFTRARSSDASPPHPRAQATATPMDEDLNRQPPRSGTPIGHDEPRTKAISLSETTQGKIGSHEWVERTAMPGAFIEESPVVLQHRPVKSKYRSRSRAHPDERIHAAVPKGDTRSRRDVPSTGNRFAARETSGVTDELHRMRARITQLEAENGRYKDELGVIKLEEYPGGSGPVGIPAHGFGTTANRASTADARRLMEDLEAEIFQTAAALSEHDFGRNKSYAPRRQECDPDFYNKMTGMLGGELVDLLSANTASHPTPEILVQISLQTAMSTWGFTKLNAWILKDYNDDVNILLSGLYEGIRRYGLLRAITDVVIAATPPGEEPVSRRKIDTEFGDRVSAAARLILDLKKTIGTSIVSDDLAPFLAEPGSIFDPRRMEDMWPEEGTRQIQGETAVCTTSLGLLKRGQNGGPSVTLMKAKVLLHSSVPQLMT